VIFNRKIKQKVGENLEWILIALIVAIILGSQFIVDAMLNSLGTVNK
jgi:hypothetical protein